MYLNQSTVKEALQGNKDTKNLVLDFSLKQLLSLKGLDQLVNAGSIQKLLLSTNYIREIEPIMSKFTNLRELDMSINHISKIDNLHNNSNLIYLNLSNNRIQRIEGLSGLPRLEVLDLSMNYLTRIENIKNRGIKTLILSGNDIKEIENLETMPMLENLELEKCKIDTVQNLALFELKNFKKIVLSFNQISIEDFDNIVKLMGVFPTLEELNFIGNEVTLFKKYKSRLLEFEQLKILDKLALRDPIKKHFTKLRNEEKIDELIEATKKEYFDRLDKEDALKNATLDMIERQKKQVNTLFEEYEKILNEDFNNFYNKAKELRMKRINGEMNEYDTLETVELWKRAVEEKAEAKKKEYDAAVSQQQLMQKEYLETKLTSQKFSDKLYEISMKNPEVWRQIKLKERVQMDNEDQEMESMKKKYIQGADDSEIQQYNNIANQIQTNMIKDIADTVMDYEAKELNQQRQKAANVLKQALLSQMINHYVDIKNKDPAEDLEIEESDPSAQRNEITEQDLREALQKEYYKGQWKSSPKAKDKKQVPKNLASQELDELLNIPKNDQSYAEQVRDKYQKKRDKSNQRIQERFQKEDQPPRNRFPTQNYDGRRGMTQNEYYDQEENLETDPFEQKTFVKPEHVVGVDARGEKIIMMPFPKPDPQEPRDRKKTVAPNQDEKQRRQTVRDPDNQRKKTVKQQEEDDMNVLDDLDRVDDNGNLIRARPNIKDYEIENKPYQMFPKGEDEQDDPGQDANPKRRSTRVDNKKKTAQPTPSPPKKSKRCNIF